LVAEIANCTFVVRFVPSLAKKKSPGSLFGLPPGPGAWMLVAVNDPKAAALLEVPVK
jgi:hypothetical protein